MIYFNAEPGLVDMIEIYLDLILDHQLKDFIVRIYTRVFDFFEITMEDLPIPVWSQKSIPAFKTIFETKFLKNEAALNCAQQAAQALKQEHCNCNIDKNLCPVYKHDIISCQTNDFLLNIFLPAELIKNLYFIGKLISAVLEMEGCAFGESTSFGQTDLCGAICDSCQDFLVQIYL